MSSLATSQKNTTQELLLVYSDPSAAHEEGLKLQSEGAFRIVITPKSGAYHLQAFFREGERKAFP